MRVSRAQALENREKILIAAAILFREKGFDGVGVADLMKQAGLTHGGFYGHFASKDELMAQACGCAVDDLLESARMRQAHEQSVDAFTVFVENYLSLNHRDNPGRGCLMAALGAEAPRQSPLVRHAFTEGAKRLLAACVSLLSATVGQQRARQRAIITLSTLVGAQIIARAVDDEAFSEEVLQTVLEHVRS